MAERLLYKEKKGSSGSPSTYLYLDSSSTFHQLRLHDKHSTVGGVRGAVVSWVCDVFLPQGYPHTVSPDYLHYQFWDSMQAFCSSIASALSLRSTLVGLGVGEESATPLAATLSWLLKDGTGMVASIVFAYWKGSQLDCNSKQWRLFADLVNNINLSLHLIGPMLPVPFLAVLCVSGVLNALVGVAGGSTRAALAVHQARCDNMADVSAKDGSQETLVNLAALLTNLLLLPYFTASTVVIWCTFLVCAFLHMYANYKAMRALTIHSLNRPRFLHILSTCLSTPSISTQDTATPEECLANCVPSPGVVNLNEPLVFGPAFIPGFFPHGFRVTLGGSLHRALKGCHGRSERDVFSAANSVFRADNYMLVVSLSAGRIYIVYHSGITAEEELEAFVMAYLTVCNYCYINQGIPLQEMFIATTTTTTTAAATTTTTTAAADYELIAEVKKLVKRIFPSLLKGLQLQGWKVDKLQFGADEWRVLQE